MYYKYMYLCMCVKILRYITTMIFKCNCTDSLIRRDHSTWNQHVFLYKANYRRFSLKFLWSVTILLWIFCFCHFPVYMVVTLLLMPHHPINRQTNRKRSVGWVEPVLLNTQKVPVYDYNKRFNTIMQLILNASA